VRDHRHEVFGICSVRYCNVSVASTGGGAGARSLTEVVAAGIKKLEPFQEAD
jgi:hypothetical protein